MDLDKSFASTSRILFGQELGSLEDYQGYLLEGIDAPTKTFSRTFRKEVYLSRPYYCKDARVLSLEEIDFGRKAEPLDINKIKDIDSLLEEMKGRLQYCGNKNIGNSKEVEKSDSCCDSVCILSSHQVMSSKYIAYSYGIRAAENLFGCMWCGEADFSIKCQGSFKSNSCWDSYLSMSCRGLYGCFNCRNTTDSMFSFNQVAKKNLIGNLALPQDKYLGIKKKLLCEIVETLKAKKTFPSILELRG